MKSPHTKNTLLQVGLSQPTKQSLQESIFSSSRKSNSNFFPPTLRCFNFFSQHTVRNLMDSASNINHFGQSVSQLDMTHCWTDRRATDNKVLPKAGVTCFYDTFVLNRALVFQINFSAKTPRLRQYPKR